LRTRLPALGHLAMMHRDPRMRTARC
jgi:hypothetical protein